MFMKNTDEGFITRWVLRVLLNICGGMFCENNLWLKAGNYFCKTYNRFMLGF